MAIKDERLDLTAKELTTAFADPAWAAKFPPILSVDQAAELLQIPKQTIYDWHSRGRLKGSCRKVGKYLRFFRDRLVILVFDRGVNQNGD
jgi:excisionase family DNA binding protein